MHTTPVHVEKNRINRNYNVLLFLIPSLIFALIISFYLIRKNIVENGLVLSNQTEVLDTSPKN